MVRIIFYRNKCIGCNGCVEAAPARWRISRADGKCNLIGGKKIKGIFQVVVNDDEYGSNFAAASNCPVKIIQLHNMQKSG